MKRQFSDGQLFEAFGSAGLASEEYYDCWTALWGLRSQIWRGKRMQKDARNSLGEVAKSAIEDGNPEVFRHLAGALHELLAFERRPENALRADVFFAIEELNRTRGQFTRTDLFSWLNKELDASITEEELDRELIRMKLSELLPAG